jgi:tyrosine-protein kinase Etk/Wzc
MAQLLSEVVSRYELVVVDSTPLSVVSDAVPLMQRVDGVILVGRIGYTTRDASRRLLERLQNLRAPILGAVANDQTRSARGYGYGGYGYGYGYGYGGYYDPPAPNGTPPVEQERDPGVTLTR